MGVARDNKKSTSFRLSPTALALLVDMAEKMGLSQAGVIELAVRKLAAVEGVTVKEEEPQW